MKIDYDSQAGAMYIELEDGEVQDTLEVGKNIVNVDLERNPLGIEILFVSRRFAAKT